MSKSRCAVVLAAGQGTRMKSSTIKVLHPVAGRPMVRRVVDAAVAAGCDPVVVVVGHQGDAVRAALADVPTVRFAVQAEQRGTGHAVRCAADALRGFEGAALLLPGDVPLIRAETLRALADGQREAGAAVTVLSMELDDPGWYGRVIRGADGAVQGIVEARDCDEAQRAVREVNTGFYAADVGLLFGDDTLAGALDELTPDNDQGELYLTDIIGVARARGSTVEGIVHGDPSEVLGVNDRAELARVEALLYRRVADHWMREGVTIQAPERARIDPESALAADAVLEPDVQLRGQCELGGGVRVGSGAILEDVQVWAGARIGPGCVLRDAEIGPDAEIRPYTVMSGFNEKDPTASAVGDRVQVGTGAKVGPFAHLRMRSRLGAGVHLGNFVETKDTVLAAGAKANHLAYLGNGRVGGGSNVGAGVIFCNYDGLDKHRTEIGEQAFVGSDSQLVAPVRVGDRAYVGSGTTVTRDVPDGALVVTRVREKVLEGYGQRKHDRIVQVKAERAAAQAARTAGDGSEDA